MSSLVVMVINKSYGILWVHEIPLPFTEILQVSQLQAVVTSEHIAYVGPVFELSDSEREQELFAIENKTNKITRIGSKIRTY